MDLLISNLLSESIFDFGKWSNGKSANTSVCGSKIDPESRIEIRISIFLF